MPGHPPRHRNPLRSRIARVAALWALATCAAAQAPLATRPALQLPLRCTPGVDCWAANYFDVDASGAARDFRCRERTYEGHDGVDFAIRDLGVMQAGVEVLAAAPGVVRNVRDGMFDAAVTDEAARARLAGRDCGNGVVIDHPGGWQTQYCHLRRGSVRVKPGQSVEAGAPLALVGLSGRTEFPHLHFTVRLGQWPVDPFTGLPTEEGCGSVGNVLWAPQAGLGYEEAALYNAGIAPGPPDIEAIRRGERTDGALAEDAPALVLWVDMLGVRVGDRLRLVIRGPDGAVLHAGESVIDRTQARRYQFSGTPRKAPAWPAGEYTGEIVLERSVDGRVQRIGSTVRARVGG